MIKSIYYKIKNLRRKILIILIQQYYNNALMSSIDVHTLCVRAAADPRHKYRGPLEGRGPQVKNRCLKVFTVLELHYYGPNFYAIHILLQCT
jgi:hypothetical protein